ncbi:MAG: S1 RNA-binding domain-containing protein, partial [Paludibacteraceae bacterium]|nr:S1 RNA-binding domain-containing protein [Paludibacteraceae bacterium]
MKSDIIIDVQQEQITTALLEDGRLMELSKESRAENVFAVGNIYYGRVKKLIPSLNAAFVDIGSEKEGFLHYSDLGSAFNTIQAYANKIRKDSRLTAINRFTLQPNCPSKGQIADVMKVGDMVLVQVMK